MRRIIFLILSVLVYSLAISQSMQVRNLNRSIRAGFENTIEFSLKRKFDSVDLRATQGTVNRDGRIIRFTPAISGQDTLFAKFYSRGKIIHLDTMTFDVIKPEVFPSLGGDLLRDRKVKLSYLKALGGIILQFSKIANILPGVFEIE